MNYIEIFLIAVGLCFDTFAVSLVGGACLSSVNFAKKIRIISFFAIFQAAFTFVGWALGSTVSGYINEYDHWVAFLLLLYIGGKMVFDAFSASEEKSVDLLSTPKLIVASIATSIDALAVGISFAMLHFTTLKIFWTLIIIAFVTAVAAAAGLQSGKFAASKLGKRSNLLGGIILIFIGIKILIEHI